MFLYEMYEVWARSDTGTLERQRAHAGALFLGIGVVTVLSLLAGVLH